MSGEIKQEEMNKGYELAINHLEERCLIGQSFAEAVKDMRKMLEKIKS